MPKSLIELNLQWLEDDLSIWTKGIPQQNGKSNNAVPRRRTTQCRTKTTNSQQQKTTKILDLCENHLFRLKVKKENS
jgi:hypothetical protein